MSDFAMNDIVARIDDFSYEEKQTLFQALRSSLKHQPKPRRIRLARGNNKEPVITKSLLGIFKDTSITLEDIRDERLARQ